MLNSRVRLERLGESDQVAKLKYRLEKDAKFKEWMKEHWLALYNDIVAETGLYPMFYATIEESFVEYEIKITEI